MYINLSKQIQIGIYPNYNVFNSKNKKEREILRKKVVHKFRKGFSIDNDIEKYYGKLQNILLVQIVILPGELVRGQATPKHHLYNRNNTIE